MSEKNHVVEFIEDPVKCQMNFADRGSEELRRASQRLQRRQKSRWKGWINNDKYPNMVKCITYPTTETARSEEVFRIAVVGDSKRASPDHKNLRALNKLDVAEPHRTDRCVAETRTQSKVVASVHMSRTTLVASSLQLS